MIPERIRNWFDSYVQGYCTTDSDGLRNIKLKIEHTHKVVEAMHDLTAGEELTPDECRIAGVVALLHDVGRFEQYRRWRTFRDSDSDNHARLAIEAIRMHRVLEQVSPEEILLIEEAVRFHNLLALPARTKSPTDLYLRLIRDADKLDIWRVFLELFRKPEHERASAATLGFPDLPILSDVCKADLAAARTVRMETVNCINDFRLLLISWVYDLNFATSYRILRERRYLPDLAALLPLEGRSLPAVAQAIGEADRRAA